MKALLLPLVLLGLGVDIFSNTPGVGAASLTLTALLQPYLLSLFVSQGEDTLLPGDL